MTRNPGETQPGQVTTLRDAIESVPEAEWVDSDGTLYTMQDILDSYSQQQLSQPVVWCEGELGEQQICAGEDEGRPDNVLLTMAPPSA